MASTLFTTFAVAALLASGAKAEEAPASHEQSKLRIATQTQLNGATGLVNSNKVLNDNNIAITRSNLVGVQNDMLKMTEASEMHAGLSLTGERDGLVAPKGKEGDDKEYYPYYPYGGFGYRYRFYNPYFLGGYYGWRYPMPYWNLYGRSIYGGYCPYGRMYGGYYYC